MKLPTVWIDKRPFDKTKLVYVARILTGPHKNMFSVRQKGKVVAYTDNIVLKNCEYVVGEGGRQRVLKTRRKNVHAFIRGILSSVGEVRDAELKIFLTDLDSALKTRVVSYNPYKAPHFYTCPKNPVDNPVYTSDFVDCDLRGEDTTLNPPVLAIWKEKE